MHNPGQSWLFHDKLKVVRGDDYFWQQGIRPTLIKIDVEGFESHVLRGMTDTIAEYSPTILMEFSVTTRAQVGSESELRKLVPETYSISRVTDRGSWQYRLDRFSFDQPSGDILLSPRKNSI